MDRTLPRPVFIALGILVLSATLFPRLQAAVTSGRHFATYIHNVSQPIPGVTVAGSIVEQYRIPVATDVELDAWIVRPPIATRVPIVLDVTPYYGGGSPVNGGVHEIGTEGEILVTRGYAYGIVSVRGTGNSSGCFSIGGPDEARDTAKAIEYLAARPWANRKVGLMGVSYDGTTPQDVWVLGTPSLKTIVPVSGISDLYKYNFVNGVPSVVTGFGFNTYYWAATGLSPAGLYAPSNQLRDPVHVPGAITGEICPEQVYVQEGGITSTINGDKDGYWQLRDFRRELSASPSTTRASVFYIHGLEDWNVQPHNMEGWLPAVQATGVPFKAWLGQWGHAFPDRADWFGVNDPDPAKRVPSVMVAWFDQFLKGRNTGVLDGPRVQVETDKGQWRHEHTWPPVDAGKSTYRLRNDGTMGGTETGGSVSYDDLRGGISDVTVNDAGVVPRAVWQSAVLRRALHVSGMPRFAATVTASGHRASLILTLVERSASGDRAINYAAQSLNHVASLKLGKSSIKDLPQRVGLNFYPQDDMIRKGSRIVLMAAGNVLTFQGEGYPSMQPISDGSIITIDLAGASLTLPVDSTPVYESPYQP